ncbi:MAG: hypothetical protein QM572_14595 [Nocardioides sp.]|uniref:hypothetical protein n=1 Tax=Nocardioides sp. TaxID=35761 RepID=UPI0039E53A1D
MLGRVLAATALALSATVMAVYGVAGTSRLSGPILFSVSSTHGVHRDDLLIVACWVVCVAIAVMLILGGRHNSDR